MSLNRASQVFGIPYATLGDKVRGRRPINAQPRTLLQAAEEERLLSWLKETARQGFGRTKSDIKDTVKATLDARGAVTNSPDNRPSKQWVADFFKRHPDLSERTPLALGKERALVTPSGLAAWFQEMKHYLDTISPQLLDSPDRLYNADETGFSLCPKSKKVIAEKGSKHVYNLSSNTKNSVTVVACCSATGHYIPPLIVFPYSRRPNFNLLAGFEEASFNITPNGWITAHVFHTWLRDCFVPTVASKTKPVVLFVDGHASHTSALEIIDLCRENGIILYCLKSHASHLIQPLDQALFGAMKAPWSEEGAAPDSHSSNNTSTGHGTTSSHSTSTTTTTTSHGPLPTTAQQPAASNFKDLLDFAAQAGPQKIDSLWADISQGGTGSADVQTLSRLLAGVGYTTTAVPTSAPNNINFASSSRYTPASVTIDTIMSLTQFPKNKC
ncbi:hypothetical protein RRG08_052503 [Elysia crispata]|uniref:HTH CENPB-type domain-containing protein n=1 Tax=Elysia crispata TaxID=231223 RepID=A0AAE0XNN6_9GAST|nr:hypothetical protein RRG08_052503 [Elysia crispata]